MASKRPFPSFLIFRDKQGHWRWNFAGPGGRILAASSQAYTRSAGCMRAIQMLKGSAKIPVVGRQVDLRAAQQQPGGGAGAPAAEKASTEGEAQEQLTEVPESEVQAQADSDEAAGSEVEQKEETEETA